MQRLAPSVTSDSCGAFSHYPLASQPSHTVLGHPHPPPTSMHSDEGGLQCSLQLKLPCTERAPYVSICSWKPARCAQTERPFFFFFLRGADLYGISDGGRREATSVLLFSALSLVLIGSFQSFSGTSAAQNNGVPRARVRYRGTRARLWPLFTAERLAGLPAELPLPCYLRADKGGRCEEEINVNPSVFN